MKGGAADAGLCPVVIEAGAGLEALIAYGRQNNNLVTYDEINDFMPLEVEGADEIDAWWAALANAGIETAADRTVPAIFAEQPEPFSPTETGLEALIAYASQHGSVVTFDEANAFMPPDFVTTDQIDEWLASLTAAGIDIVDNRSDG